jgi:hypothetical protein
MNCQNCNQVIEAGAAFCGNCGYPVQAAVPANPADAQPLNEPFATVNAGGLTAGVPGYAFTAPSQHAGENKALLALLFGIAGIAGSLFMALIGLVLGIAGLIMGTMSRSSTKRDLSTAGLAISSLAVLTSLAVWTYVVKHDSALQNNASQTHNVTAPAVSASGLSTPCYSTGFVDKLNVSNSADSCDMSAFNGSTLDNSTNAYKVAADQSQIANARNFTSLVKAALEKDVKNNLPGFAINTEQVTEFAGSPAYIVSTFDKAHGISVVEAAVLHQVENGENIFILVHAMDGRTADLSTLEAQWQWK